MAGVSAQDTRAMTRQVLALDPATYRRHALHGETRIWAETNCYVDLWIELLHALGHEPMAALPFTLAIDFEGDQWTFFKFPLSDLYELYGIDVQELAIWRPLTAHLEEQIARGRPVLVELDSYYLPDTAGTAYQLAHVKTTVAAVRLDVEQQLLGYFHNAGYFELRGDDFTNVLQPPGLPPYVEFVKMRDANADLVQTSLRHLRKHLHLVPDANPFASFKERFARDLDGLLQESLDAFHQYSFATLRQLGACYELSASYLQWLTEQGETGLEESTRALLEISESAKAFQFQLARAMARRRPLDLSPLDAMGERWALAIGWLKARYR
jgi:Domain of unknown function (DUF1839)